MAVDLDLVPWEQFYNLVRPMAQDCPVGIVDAAIRAACIEFCQKSLIWSREAACGSIVAGERIYKYNNENDQVSIVMPICCIINEGDTDTVLTPTNRHDLDYYEPQWRKLEKDIPSRYFSRSACSAICHVTLLFVAVRRALSFAVKLSRLPF